MNGPSCAILEFLNEMNFVNFNRLFESISQFFQSFFSVFQEKPLLHNTAEGVILTNRSLVLQGIDRARSGGYTCQAINAVGSGQSQAIELDVKCKSNLLYKIE